MGFTEAVKAALSKSVTWQGRARRAEFWYFQLFIIMTLVASAILDQLWGTPVLTAVAWIGLILPFSICHDPATSRRRQVWWVVSGSVLCRSWAASCCWPSCCSTVQSGGQPFWTAIDTDPDRNGCLGHRQGVARSARRTAFSWVEARPGNGTLADGS